MLLQVLAACSSDPAEGRVDPRPDVVADGWAERPDLDALAAASLEDAHVPGAAVALVHHGEVVWANVYGMADAGTGAPVTPESVFMLASISKTVTATALMMIRDQGLLDLDDEVDENLSFAVVHPTDPERITLRHLLTHTSGLLDDWGVFNQNYFEGDASTPLLTYLEDYLVPGGQWYQDDHYAAWSPGARYEYSNIGVALVGGVVEETTGEPFDRWCDANLFEPLGLVSTGWHLADVDVDLAAHPHQWQDGTWEVVPHYGYPDYPDGQLRSTATELATFLATYASGGAPILAAETVDEIWTEQLTDVVSDQGLVWYFVPFGDRLVGHSGSDTGVATEMWIDARGDGYVLLMNATPTTDAPVLALQYALLQAAQEWGTPP